MSARTFGLAAVFVVVGGASAGAQSTDPNQAQPGVIHIAPPSPLVGVRVGAPHPMTIQGVPAQLPGPVVVGGVPFTGPGSRVAPIVPPARVAAPSAPPPVSGGHGGSEVFRPGLGGGTVVTPWRPGSGRDGLFGYPVTDASGFSLRGNAGGDNWRLAFRAGAGFPLHGYRRGGGLLGYYSPWSSVAYIGPYGYTYYDPYAPVGYGEGYTPDPRLTMPPQPAVQQPVRELTTMEQATIALRIGDSGAAVRLLKDHLQESPDDAGAERLLAMALIDDRRVDQAVAVLVHAYTKQPQLARDPIDPRMLFGGEMSHRHRLTMVMEYANRTKTGSALFAAATLAQSEGRYDVAKKLLDRAVAAGLDEKVGEEMKLALTNR